MQPVSVRNTSMAPVNGRESPDSVQAVLPLNDPWYVHKAKEDVLIIRLHSLVVGHGFGKVRNSSGVAPRFGLVTLSATIDQL